MVRIACGLVVFLAACTNCSPKVPEADSPSSAHEQGASSTKAASGPLPAASPVTGAATPLPHQGSPASQVTEIPQAKLAPELFPEGVFPPPDPGAPFEKTAHQGDGMWRAFFDLSFEDGAAGKDGSAGKRASRMQREVGVDFAGDVVRRLTIHPDQASRFQTLSVAAFDLRKLALGHRPGRQDVEDVGHPELFDVAGLVPVEDQSALLAVFNEGFQPRHGRWGMLSLGTQLIAPRDDACTVAVLSDRTLRVAPWPDFKGSDASPATQLLAYRQTPPCLVLAGEVHPRLLKRERASWAGQQADLKTRRRSAIGVSRDGRTLFFAVGTETEPEVLAAGMRHVGAHFAAQLDINWNWTRLFLFENDKTVAPSSAALVGSLIADMARDRGEYISRPGKRGFFMLTYR